MTDIKPPTISATKIISRLRVPCILVFSITIFSRASNLDTKFLGCRICLPCFLSISDAYFPAVDFKVNLSLSWWCLEMWKIGLVIYQMQVSKHSSAHLSVRAEHIPTCRNPCVKNNKQLSHNYIALRKERICTFRQSNTRYSSNLDYDEWTCYEL